MSYQITNKAGMWKNILFLLLLTLPFSAAHAGRKADLSSRVNHGNHLSVELQALADSSTDGYVDVIIQFTSAPQDADDAAVANEGGAHTKDLTLVNGNVYHVPVKALKHLANNPHVLYITPDRATSMTGDTAYVDQSVNATIAQSYGYDGTGVGVAVIDSGVLGHRDLQNRYNSGTRIVYSESFVTGVAAVDNYGHGSHVAGILAGNGAASSGTYKGVAPNANIINLRALDSNGGGSDSTVIAAINRAIQLKSQYNIRVINLSLGRPVFESYTLDPLCQAVEQAWKAGIFVAVAAGNNGRDNTYGTLGYATINAPGNDPFVITVGATNTNGTPNRSDDLMTSFSSKGPSVVDHIVKPDVVAPGNNVTSLYVPGSTLANLLPGDIISDNTTTVNTLLGSSTLPAGYFTLSGTSMATPVVAGTAALMIQRDPTLTPDQIKARIMKTAGKLGRTNSWSQDRKGNRYNNQYDVFTVGAGYLDTWAALNNLDKGAGYALSPAAYKSALTGQILFTGKGISNGLSVIWGDSVVWGIDTTTANSVIWSDSVIWGGDVIDASSVIWGTSVIWGDTSGTTSASSVIWGTSVIWGVDVSLQGLSGGDDDVAATDTSSTTSSTTTTTTTTTTTVGGII